MDEKKDFTEKLKQIRDISHRQGTFVALLVVLNRLFAKAGIGFTPLYYMKEVLTSDIPPHLTNLPDGFEFSTFALEDLEEVKKHPERKGYVDEEDFIKNLNRGDTCLGIRHKGELAGFTWFSTSENRSKFCEPVMKNNEAYLYTMYIFKAFRGHNLAPTLRYKNYELLKSLGRDTFYSVTDCTNGAALRFKQKLGANIVFLGVHINLFKKWRKTFVLKKY
jgi:ribosomal protein S18 acetylase RimI-like enzyme